jgi:hypothetical protein
MIWIDIEKENKYPRSGQRCLVVKRWLDAVFEDGGYNSDKSFCTFSHITVDFGFEYENKFKWEGDGDVTHWMPLPELPINE